MEGNINEQSWAAAYVPSNGTNPTVRGCSIVRTSQGVYTMTLDKELDMTQCVITATPIGGSGSGAMFPVVEHVSDSSKVIRFFYASGGAAQDADFSVRVTRIAP